MNQLIKDVTNSLYVGCKRVSFTLAAALYTFIGPTSQRLADVLVPPDGPPMVPDPSTMTLHTLR